MPWTETCEMKEKINFIAAWQSEVYNMTDLCHRFGISRKTGYKWVDRYRQEGVDGLKARSRACHHHPNAISEEVIHEILKLKSRYSQWGPKKLHDWLVLNRPHQRWPVVSTFGDILERHGLVNTRKKKKRTVPKSAPLSHCEDNNQVWSSDFKGQFRLGQGKLCYPLTISDNHSRYLLMCRGLYRPTEQAVRPWFERVFREYGLPDAMRTDNGSPFASTALGGLTQLTIWWVKLGIRLERIAPGHPEQNGRHERMHRTLKAHTAKPPKQNLSAQQRAFNRFCHEYNYERPHEALGGCPPSHIYEGSRRDYPAQLPEIEYGEKYILRRVRTDGMIKWRGKKIYVSEALRGEPVGLLPFDDDCWQLYFSHMVLGELDERLGKIIRLA
ncbi:MAG: integrase core domain-containing protein [Gammaproteobacteria bacterium]|nr:integrase core domain-containing protein [Gammaproteobacteria bacterium]